LPAASIEPIERPAHLSAIARGVPADAFRLVYVEQLNVNQVHSGSGAVAIAQGGARQSALEFVQPSPGVAVSTELKKPEAPTGAEIDAIAARGGTQEDFDNEGAGARIRAVADGGAQKNFKNRTGEPVARKQVGRAGTWTKVLLAAFGAAGAIAGAVKAYLVAKG
jgi:hypothetical protein